MKMKTEHYNDLSQAIQERINEDQTPSIITLYETGQFPRSDRVKDLNKRFRWDLFWFVMKRRSNSITIEFDNLKYLNDIHIDTALRKIVPQIIRQY